MFIDALMRPRRPPSGGPCESWFLVFIVDMALLTEGGDVSLGVYKHLPPDGGETSKLKTEVGC